MKLGGSWVKGRRYVSLWPLDPAALHLQFIEEADTMNDRKPPIRPSSIYHGARPTVRPVLDKPPAAANDSKPAARHSSTTPGVYTYHGYKSWIEGIRGAWQDKK